MTKPSFISDPWIEKHYLNAQQGLDNSPFYARMEVFFHSFGEDKKSSNILSSVKNAREQAHWPLGYYPAYRQLPYSDSDGIWYQRQETDESFYLYWTARNNGHFYALQSLSDDEVPKIRGKWFSFDWNILEVYKSVMFASCLHEQIGTSIDTRLCFYISYQGLKSRTFTSKDPARYITPGKADKDRYAWKAIDSTYLKLRENIIGHVFEICDPLFALFNREERPAPDVYADVVNYYRRQLGMKPL